MEVREKLKKQIKEIKKSLYGINEIIKIYCLSKAADLTVLMLGEHAIAKSSLSRDWSTTTGLDFRIVTSSEVDESLIAYIDPAVFRTKNIVQMKRGELMLRDHILVDEFFLWPNKFRSKLHQLLEERTYAGLTVKTKTYTFASNPLTEHYSGQIEDRNLATEDRIDLLLPMYQPSIVPTQNMMKKFSSRGRHEVELNVVISWKDYLKAREEIMKVELPSDILVWLTLFAESMSTCRYSNSKFDISRAKMHTLCSQCNQHENLCAKVALSKPRFLRATLLLSKALAWFKGKDEISEEEVLEAIKFTLPHRLIFLKEEKTIFEAERAIPEILQEFIDDFNNWEARRIFRKLEGIIEKAKDLETPFFDSEAANILISDVAEHLAISNYVKEGIERVQEAVKKRYKEILEENPPETLQEMKEILEKSGLDLYEKGQLLDDLVLLNPNLTFKYKLDRRNKKEREKIADSLIKIHQEGNLKIKSKSSLLRGFTREIAFTSDLFTIREERGGIRITAATPELKTKIEQLLRKKK